MTQSEAVRNPFMLMLNPEIVLAAIEKSERLSQLNRHLCRPLDKPAPASAAPDVGSGAELNGEMDQDNDSERSLAA